MSIEAVGVAVPARDEELLLPGCLDAVARAAAAVDVPVHVVVALDTCVDASATVIASRPDIESVVVHAGNVGVARAASVAALLAGFEGVAPDRLWLATTDADTVVPTGWLAGQLSLADQGWEVVVGTVVVDDWSEHPPSVRATYSAAYQPVDGHPHVHGANLGCTAAAYVEAGGWPPLAAHEDVALLAAMAHRRVVRTATVPVVTSGRRLGRVTGGFADALRELTG